MTSMFKIHMSNTELRGRPHTHLIGIKTPSRSIYCKHDSFLVILDPKFKPTV